MASIISDIKYCYDRHGKGFFYKGLLSYKDKTVKLKEPIFGSHQTLLKADFVIL